MTWTTTSTVSLGFTTLVPVADAIGKATGVSIRVEPGGNSYDRGVLARTKEAVTIFEPGSGAQGYAAGAYDMERDGWGPQRLRVLWLAGQLATGFVTRGNSGIKAVQDVRGKRVATFPGYPLTQAYMDGYLAFAGLTWNDAIPVPFAGSGPAWNAVIAGTVDASFMTQDTATAYELEASPGGIYWIPLPASDVEGWKRLQAYMPVFSPYTVTSGPGASPQKPAQIAGMAFYNLAYRWQDENLVYWLTKTKTENYDNYKNVTTFTASLTLENAVKVERSALPYHPGAIKYYREAGVWGAKEDAWQEKMLVREEASIAAWKAKHPDWKWQGE